MGTGSSRGDDRAVAAAEMAISSPLLEASIDGAHGVLLSIQGGSDLGLFEINEAAQLVSNSAAVDANIIFGAVIDDALGDEVRVTVIAAGLDENRNGRVAGSAGAADSGSSSFSSNGSSGAAFSVPASGTSTGSFTGTDPKTDPVPAPPAAPHPGPAAPEPGSAEVGRLAATGSAPARPRPPTATTTPHPAAAPDPGSRRSPAPSQPPFSARRPGRRAPTPTDLPTEPGQAVSRPVRPQRLLRPPPRPRPGRPPTSAQARPGSAGAGRGGSGCR